VFSDLGPLERHVIEDRGLAPEEIATIVLDRFAAGELTI
jgi:hypothetical protein